MIYYHQLDPFLVPPLGSFKPLWYLYAYILTAVAIYLLGKYFSGRKEFFSQFKLLDSAYFGLIGPVLLFISGFGIRWYSLAYITAVMFAYFAGKYLINKERLKLPDQKLLDIVFFGAVGTVLGGRLGYCVFYAPELFLSFDMNIKAFPYWGVLKIHQGGMSSHGGIIGFFISQIIYAYRHKLSFFSLIDLGSVTGAFGIFLGRIANFINGELYGRVLEGTTWFAVRFPSELYLWANDPEKYKNQLLSLKELLPFLSERGLIKVSHSAGDWEQWINRASEGSSVYEGFIYHICNVIVQQASQAPVKAILEPLLSLRYPSQLYQSFFGGLVPFLIICTLWLKPKKAGLISLVWAGSYLCFRVFTEFYRQPDSHVGFELFHLTRGQWLSVLLYLMVISYGYLVYKQEPKGFKKY